jgi:outer membrane biosynthesis protein TonB
MIAMKRAGLIVAGAVLVGSAACSNKSESMDAALKADIESAAGGGIELAPTAAKSQVVISAIEGGPKAAPAPAAQKRAPAPSPRPATRVAEKPTPAPTPAPVPVAEPVQEQPVVSAPAPRPVPVQSAPAPQQDKRVYKTEAEIFRQMPWIKP